MFHLLRSFQMPAQYTLVCCRVLVEVLLLKMVDNSTRGPGCLYTHLPACIEAWARIEGPHVWRVSRILRASRVLQG